MYLLDKPPYIYEQSENVLYLGEAYGPNTMGQIIINTMQTNIINPNISINKNKYGTWY